MREVNIAVIQLLERLPVLYLRRKSSNSVSQALKSTVLQIGGGCVPSARVSFAFNRLRSGDTTEDLRTSPVTYEGEATKKEDAAKIGGGAVGGAIIGGILGGKSGAAKGAAIGGVRMTLNQTAPIQLAQQHHHVGGQHIEQLAQLARCDAGVVRHDREHREVDGAQIKLTHPAHEVWIKAYEKVRVEGTTTIDILVE